MSVDGEMSGSSGHYICVDIHRIYRVGDGNPAVGAENVADVSGIAFSSVADEYLVGRYFYAASAVVCVCYFFTQEVIALFGTVTVKCPCVRLFVDGLVHGVNDSAAYRQGDIADAHADYVGGWMGLFKSVDSSRYFRKQVADG